ncbi:MAG: acyl-CoA dehydratase activase-related protein [Bacillota bacterium]
MTAKIGIPRSLLFYNYYPLWKTFFEEIGAEVIASGPTTKTILQDGLKLSVDEACLPVKVAFGHVEHLRNRVDYIFIPRLVSISPREYICPKFLGFPDMVRQCIPGLPGIIDTNINVYRRERDLYKQFREIGKNVCNNPVKITIAYLKAKKAMHEFKERVEAGTLPDQAFINSRQSAGPEKRTDITIALIGHPYNIYDSFINIQLVKRLEEAGARVLTADTVPEDIVNKYAATLSKKLFWTLGRRMIGAAYHFIENPEIKGIIHVASFACGPDSMTGELIERKIRRTGSKPFLNLTLDEHTGEAGIVTRIEAFLDMVGMKDQATSTGTQ